METSDHYYLYYDELSLVIGSHWLYVNHELKIRISILFIIQAAAKNHNTTRRKIWPAQLLELVKDHGIHEDKNERVGESRMISIDEHRLADIWI